MACSVEAGFEDRLPPVEGEVQAMVTRAGLPRIGVVLGGRSDPLTAEVLSIVASRVAPRPGLRTMCLDLVIAAAATADRAERAACLATARAEGATAEEIIDLYIPEAARRMGEGWLSDDMTFAEVTIGAARLQAIVRDIEGTLRPGRTAAAESPSILMIVPVEEDHTLGPMVAACQFRRAGASVHMVIGQGAAPAVEIARRVACNMITISLSSESRVESVRMLIQMLRAQSGHSVPIVVGGPTHMMKDETRMRTGADHVTASTVEALALCDLILRDVAPRSGAVKIIG